eukprot:CAMPEP_0202725820 /NCGR_PEP_ID=MMETSP1385-20130828/184297_1 /ASSEMBLY_ACC=CAM_ASM_000861 /TAXON_ID=933848 /ORGANISM="Elphidium margaritaceum" /LENGTH=622 /DNA_ID=CAMNT_0049392025 /DNA_START=93 /DNA_END=1961 /DNA_ORIENTATION=-
MTHNFPPVQVAGFRAAFDEWNADGNAHLDQGEMLTAMKGLGVDVNALGDMLKQVDANNDGNIDFDEFLAALWQVKQSGDASGFSNMVNKQVELIAIKTASGGVKSYSQDEVTAFANHLNYCLGDDPKLKYLMPINPSNLDLMEKVADGVMLARFINMIESDTIDWRAVNYKKKGGLNQYHVIENQNLNIAAAKAIGLRIYNLSAEDLRDAAKNPILVLGFMWQAVKMQLLGNINLKSNPELIALLDDGEDMNSLLALPPEELLKRWVNYHLEKEEYPTRIKNFSSDVKDGKVYTVLLKSIGGNKGCNRDPLEWDADKRCNQVIVNAQKIGAKPFITKQDILSGNDKLNMAFVAQLFNTCPGLAPVNVEEQKELAGLLDDDEGDSREERAFRMWMNSLGIKDVYVNNLFEDVRAGLVLLKVIDKIEPGSVKWKSKVERKPNNKFKKINNTNYAVDLGKQMKLTMVNVQGADITDRNKKLILGFTWQLMRYHLLKFLASISVDGKKVTDQDVLAFCNSSVKNSDLPKKPQIKSFNDSTISSGEFFIYLVASIDPEIVNWELVTEGQTDEDKNLNAKYAISLARKMGAIIFLLPDDIVEIRNKMCMTFCAAVMAEAYKRSGKMKK